jgi:hypothetical protein
LIVGQFNITGSTAFLGDFCSGSAAASVLFRSGVAVTVTDGSKIVARVGPIRGVIDR